MKSAGLGKKIIAMVMSTAMFVGCFANTSIKAETTNQKLEEGAVVPFKATVFDYDMDSMNQATMDMVYKDAKSDEKLWSNGKLDEEWLVRAYPAFFFTDKGGVNERTAGSNSKKISTSNYSINKAENNRVRYNCLDSGASDLKGTAYQGLVGSTLYNNLPDFNLYGVNPFDMNAVSGKKDCAVYQNQNVEFKYENGYYVLDSKKYEYKYDQAGNTLKVGRNVQGTNAQFFPFDNIGRKNSDGHNVHFGLSMEVDFSMPTEGKNNNEDYVFQFSGDDDVWIFIDGKLILDLGGIHEASAASVNFAQGIVTYENHTYNETGKLGTGKGTYYKDHTSYSFAEIGVDRNAICDNKQHKLQIFYMERGGGESNCKITFNMPVVGDGSGDYSFTKKSASDERVLSGAEFQLIDISSKQVCGTAVSDDNGKVTFKDVKAGTYWVRETKAPAGYDRVEDYMLVAKSIGDDRLAFSLQKSDGTTVDDVIYDPVTEGLHSEDVTKTATLDSWQNRTYDIQLGATVEDTTISRDDLLITDPIDVVLVLDASWSMNFPSALTTYTRGNRKLDKNQEYYFVTENSQSTVYRAYYDDNAGSWMYIDASNNGSAPGKMQENTLYETKTVLRESWNSEPIQLMAHYYFWRDGSNHVENFDPNNHSGRYFFSRYGSYADRFPYCVEYLENVGWVYRELSDSSSDYQINYKNYGEWKPLMVDYNYQEAAGYTYTYGNNNEIKQFYRASSDGVRFDQMETAVNSFIDQLAAGNENTRIGVVWFNSQAEQMGEILDLTGDNAESIKSSIAALRGQLASKTCQEKGMQVAQDILAQMSEPAQTYAVSEATVETESDLTDGEGQSSENTDAVTSSDAKGQAQENTDAVESFDVEVQGDENEVASGETDGTVSVVGTGLENGASSILNEVTNLDNTVSEVPETQEGANLTEADSASGVNSAGVSKDGDTSDQESLDGAEASLLSDDMESYDPANNKKYVVLVTDGCPTNETVTTDTILEDNGLKDQIEACGAKIMTIGVDINDYMMVADELLNSIATEEGYYVKGSSLQLPSLFQTILKEVVDEQTRYGTGTVVDYIDSRFELIDAETGGVLTEGTQVNSQGKTATEADAAENTGTVHVDGNGQVYVEWTNVALNGWGALLKIRAKDPYVGGNAVSTNGPGSGVTLDSGEKYDFPQPKVNVRIQFAPGSTDDTIFLGQTLERYFDDNQLEKLFTVNGLDTQDVDFVYSWKDDKDENHTGSLKDYQAYIAALTPDADITYQLNVTAVPKVGGNEQAAQDAAENMKNSSGELYTASMQSVEDAESIFDENGKDQGYMKPAYYYVKVLAGTLNLSKCYDKKFADTLPYSKHESEQVNAIQTAVFTIERYAEDTTKDLIENGEAEPIETFQVSITDEDSVQVEHLKAGVYRVVEDEWTWRYRGEKGIVETMVSGINQNNFETNDFEEADGIFYFGKYRDGLTAGQQENTVINPRDEVFAYVELGYENRYAGSKWLADTTNVLNVFKERIEQDDAKASDIPSEDVVEEQR